MKKGNLSNAEFEGIKEIKENENLMVFSTDKPSKFTADTIENYESALNEHIKDDTEINEKEVRKIEAKRQPPQIF